MPIIRKSSNETIDPSTLYTLIVKYSDSYSGLLICPFHAVLNGQKYNEWLVMDKKLISSPSVSDDHYEIVLKNVTTGRFYTTCYCKSSIDNTEVEEDCGGYKVIPGGRCDLDCNLKEVTPQVQTITTYKPI